MDRLHGMNGPPKGQKAGGAARGKPAGLKTYMLERNGAFRAGRGDGLSWEVADTGVDEIKTLSVRRNGETAALQFYMDMEDRRFLLLHTGEPAKRADGAVEGLVGERRHALDHAWFHPGLLKRWARSLGGGPGGHAISRGGAPARKDDTPGIKVGGTSAQGPHGALPDPEGAGRLLSHEAIGVRRGTKRPAGAFVEERMANTGRFSIRRGGPIEAHLGIVNACREDYGKMVTSVEKCRMGAPAQGGHAAFGGRPIAITYPEANNLAQLVDSMFNAKKPFRLWGLKMLRNRGQYSVPAVDLHEGSAINFEITPRMMRIYLRKGSRGSAILRLLTNLQAHYGAQAECDGLE